MTGLRAGEVLLLHDADHYSAAGSWRHTVGALELLLPALKRNGLGTARA
jgi:peptidoglycan-N-acetylglucosamine deacetylase